MSGTALCDMESIGAMAVLIDKDAELARCKKKLITVQRTTDAYKATF